MQYPHLAFPGKWLTVSIEMQCSFKTELVAYVYTLMIAHLLISNLYPAYFQKGPGVADKIRQRHNRAIKKNQRSSPERKKGLLIIAETWVNIVASIKKKLYLALSFLAAIQNVS